MTLQAMVRPPKTRIHWLFGAYMVNSHKVGEYPGYPLKPEEFPGFGSLGYTIWILQVLDVSNELVQYLIYSTFVCSSWFVTSYHGRSPLNHHVGNMFCFLQASNMQIQAHDGYIQLNRYNLTCARLFWERKSLNLKHCFSIWKTHAQ